MENELKFIDLKDEDGKKIRFEVIETVEVNDNKYLIVAEESMDEDDAIVLCMEESDDECFFRPVEDDDELETVNEAYEEILESLN
ncbi:Protein of unknown function [Hathewaya proteolytica DSM 3090]|uniref:Uncharacterized protein n=1 Tax=Hathewaya proteolytica DSM 3090 TaxID=1121331 RepID=A0A1M6JCQ7_9CLOT|nr:DUF1292 domain-containing protein [Hathewaya proteolytica]SHJ44526.1 Protein of unknown function [Hathewaya proteolytica DSM 3090]